MGKLNPPSIMYIKYDEEVTKGAKALFGDFAIKGFRSKNSLGCLTKSSCLTDMSGTRIDISASEDGRKDHLSYDYGDIVIECANGKFLNFTTSEWSSISDATSMVVDVDVDVDAPTAMEEVKA